MFGISLMYLSAIVFTIIYPTFLNNYTYVWIPPVLSILDVIIVGYAILSKRFLDIRLLIVRIFKFAFAFSVSAIATYGIFKGLIYFSRDTLPIIYLNIFCLLTSVSVYWYTTHFLNSSTFYRLFGMTDVEHYQHVIKNLQNRSRGFTTVKSFESAIQKAFGTKNKKILPRIIPLNHEVRKRYPQLIKYFNRNSGILVTEEVRFVESQEKRIIPFLNELENLGGVCLPIFHPSSGLVGFFVVGEKSYNHLYSKQEIKALEEMGAYLNFIITGILYNYELEEEVKIKTAQLQKKTDELRQKVKEIRELVNQQSDFIAVTAHELRTPLSISLFQIQDVIDRLEKFPKKNAQMIEDINIAYGSLEKLKEMIQKMFSVQQYDLNKVTINLARVDIQKMVSHTYKDFIPVMKERSLQLEFKDGLKPETYLEIDEGQMRQVFHNILTNARNFTPQDGKIIMETSSDRKGNVLIKISDNGKGIPDDFKKKVFEKFRTNHAAKGIGLGLYICRKIVELHGGKIWVEDAKTGGACFCIQLKPNGLPEKTQKGKGGNMAKRRKVSKKKTSKKK